MRLPDKVKFLLVLCSGLIFFISGCVDTSVQTIPDHIVYNSQVKFTNLVTGAGTATLSLNNQSVGDLGFGEESSLLTFQAGSKTLSATFSNAANTQYLFSLDTDYKYRVLLVGTAASSNAVRNAQRYIFQTPDVSADSALVTFFNGSPGGTVLGMAISGPQTGSVSTALSTGDFSSTESYIPGDYSVEVTYANVDTLSTTFTYSVEKAHKYTAVVYDTLSTLKFKVFMDD
jgi:hypothetical protein